MCFGKREATSHMQFDRRHCKLFIIYFYRIIINFDYLVNFAGLEVMLMETLTYLVKETFSVNYKVWVYNHVASTQGRYWRLEKDLGLFIQYRIGLDDEHIVKGILHNVLGDYKVKSRSIGVAEVKAFALVLLQGCLMCLGK
ncbi:uncharacterized protein LOC141700666 [Apium graveolens]|uniref:uncharacterized protein LOC141700666 n=1 Tax=Apium graveolens TaxID=4045 RepID=UPI003D79CEFE